MFDKQRFIKSAFNLDELPSDELPEVILCGRSNVGKSSFINSFFSRKDLAKVSSTPGKTRSINFYNIDDKFMIVDLPGYGYAKISKIERAKWSNLVGEFLKKSNNIRLAIHFIDSRHKPTELDHELNLLLTKLKIPYLILLSKSDKLKQSEVKIALKRLNESFPDLDIDSNVAFYSSIKPRGRKEISQLFKELFY
jgi:GTP-binding protein